MFNFLFRRIVAAAVMAAVGAAASYIYRRMTDPQNTPRRAPRQERVDMSRWEGEGGSPPDSKAAVPHHEVALR